MAAFFHGGTEAREASSPTSEFALQQPQHGLLPMNSFDHALVHAPSSLPVVPTTVDMFTSTPHHHHPYNSSCFGSLVDPDPTRDVMNPGLSRSDGFELLPRPLFPAVSPLNGKKLSLSLYDQQTQTQTDHVEQGNSPVSTVTNGVLFRTNGNGFNTRYLKAAQELLDEIVNVGNTKKIDSDVSKGKLRTKTEFSGDEFSGSDCIGVGRKAIVGELTPAYRHELQIKKAKLVSMVEEVEQRYRYYHDQMQAIVSPFEQAAGLGAAKSYTSLALQTISKQFRSLKIAISSQIKLIRMGLGEEYISSNVGEGCRLLRIADQTQLRHLGVMQQHHNHADAWRPRRGLPERAVSILRAWLFEHFLHPYPKDLDKQMLAKQTGLTRSQVSNWFINARVRLWKPMVEEMYLEELKVEGKRNDDNINEDNDLELGVSSWKQPSHNASDLLIPENLSFYINNKNNNVSDQCSSSIVSTNCLTIASHHGGIFSPQKKRRTTENDFTMTNSSSNIVSFDVERKQQISHAARDANNTIHFNGGLENHQQTMYGNAVSLSLGLPHPCDKTFTNIPFGTSNQIGFSAVFSSPTYQNTDNLDKQRFVANATTLLPDFIA